MTVITKINKNKILYSKYEIIILIVITLLFIFRTAIPFFKYPFILFYFIFISYALMKYRSNAGSAIISFFKNYVLVFLLFIILTASFLFSNKLYLVIFKDWLNILVLLSFFYFLKLIISCKEQFNIFIKSLDFIILILAFVISFKSFWDLFSLNESVVNIDNNFALISILFGFIVAIKNLLKENPIYKFFYYNILLILFTLSIVLSTSRRGLFILLVIIVTIIIIQLLQVIIKNKYLNKLSIICRPYLYSITILVMVLYLFFNTSYKFKNQLLKTVGITNVYQTKKNITRTVFKYVNILYKDIDYVELLDIIWSHQFDPNDPESGWGTRKHSVVYPLNGDNVQMVPKSAKGYLMDSSCNISTWNNSAYSFTKFIDLILTKEDRIKASVFCYVSGNFNGNYVKIKSEGQTFNKKSDYYDLNRKGAWQKLEIEPECNEGNVPIYLYFAKYGVTDFSTLKGYVIFAYPTYQIISRNDTIKCDSLQTNTLKIFKKPHCQIYKSSLNMASIVSLSFLKLPVLFISEIKDPDPLRNWIKNIFNEDTTYYGLKSDVDININAKDAIHGRTDRWQFAWQIYKKEYNWKQKIFGGGFDFLNWYGYYFYKDKTKSDWPHNPFLSVLLYSGVIGLILYLYLLYRVFAIYIKYIKKYLILFIFFGITFFFSFFSAGNPFDPPVMGFFIMLPFFIDYIHKKDNSC